MERFHRERRSTGKAASLGRSNHEGDRIMIHPTDNADQFRSLRKRWAPFARALAAILCFAVNGCAALTSPVVEGIPVRHLPDELLARPKDEARTIPLDLLGQSPPDTYRLAPEDVLGVFIDNILQDSSKERTTVNVAPLLQVRDQRRLPPSLGYPISVRPDGTIRLPMIDPLKVQGLSVGEAEDAIRGIYIQKKLLPENRDRIVVTLMYPRQTHVVVLRQESGNITLGPEGGLAGGKRGTGHVVDLPAYENDVLHAISETGGLPGLDAYNKIIVFRNSFAGDRERAVLLDKLRALPPGCDPGTALGNSVQAVKIQLRRRPDEPLMFGPEDVLLHNGDVVFVEARDFDLFYTAGLLPSGEHILPRDYDLDVIKAITRVQGPLVNGAFSTNSLAGNLIQPGLGGPSPSLLTVLRRAPDGGQVPIRVDLDRAMHDPRERIIVRPGDVLVLQEKPSEALSRYMTQTFFNFNLAWKVIRSSTASGYIDVATPDRLSNPTVNLTPP
jgi:protein involved in polysaccharide export with SLBB domain